MPHFKKRNIGKIIQLSGGGAAAPLPRISGYAVSKVGIVRFIENLSEEVKDYQIDINSVAPGAINTKMLNEVLEAGPKKIGNYAYPLHEKNYSRGGHGLFSTINDYAIFAKMLHSGKSEKGEQILNNQTLRLISTNFLECDL